MMRHLPWLLAAAWLWLQPATAVAQSIQVNFAALEAVNESYQLNADFEIELGSTLEQALNKGITLNFLIEFQLVHPRWYWLDEKIAQSELEAGLNYNALTRQYRLSSGALSQNFDTLAEALNVLRKMRNRPVVERAALKKDETYAAALRMRLDISRLPKPFQVEAIGSREWNVASGWLRWSVTPLGMPAPIVPATPRYLDKAADKP